jgi:arylformamidase
MSAARVVDLTYPITNEMIVYPGFERPAFQWLGRINAEGYNLTRFSMIVHIGTHADAPCHFIEGGASIDQIPPERFIGTCRMYRSSAAPSSREIALEEVRESGFDLGEGEIFVLSTGIEALANTGKYNALHPYPAQDLVRWLLAKKIRAYMTDATSVDPPEPGWPNHHLLLEAGIPIVENLRNLAELPANRPFVICAVPLKLGGREGAPCRAFALPDVEAVGL